MSNNYGVKTSKSEVDVRTATSKGLAFSAQFDTFKIALTGTLTLSLPEETLGIGDYVSRNTTVAHGRGYAPMFAPFVEGLVNSGLPWSTDTWTLNDEAEALIPFAYDFSVTEEAFITSDSTHLKMTIDRTNIGLGPVIFGAHDVVLYYTIFYNKIDEAFDLT